MGVGRHTIYNLAGAIAPLFVSVVTVPIYLHLVGDTRYGVLSIVWLFLGYFGLFDPGLSRAATYHIARLHDAPAKERGDVFWTALVVSAGFRVSKAINVENSFPTQLVPLGVAYVHGPDLASLVPAILLARAVPEFWAVIHTLPLGNAGGFRANVMFLRWVDCHFELLAPILTTIIVRVWSVA